MTLKPSAWKDAARRRGEDCYRAGMSHFKAPIILESHTPGVASHFWKMGGQRHCEVGHIRTMQGKMCCPSQHISCQMKTITQHRPSIAEN